MLPARCGELSLRTAWVLAQANVPTPILIEDVRATAGMICRRKVIQVSPEDTFLDAYQMMTRSGVRAVPVVNQDGSVLGILRYLDLLELLLPSETQGLAVRTVHVSLKKMAATLGASHAGAAMPDDSEEEALIILVGASSQDTVQMRLDKAIADGTIHRFLVICGDRPYVHEQAIQHGVRCLLITGNYKISAELEKQAKEKGIVVLHALHDTASCTTLIRCSRAVKSVIDEGFITVPASEPVTLLKKRIASQEQDLFPVMDAENAKMLGVVSKSDLIDPPRLRLALVDHNEYAQAVRGVEEAQVVEVIDHHRLAGDITSREPIRYLNEPVGSTSTLVARKYHHRDLTPTPGVALCLLAGIISDTLNLTSPTATELDVQMHQWLASIAKVNPAEFSQSFFAVGSLLAHASCEEILNADRKEFTDEGLHISIAQVEELGLEALQPRISELQEKLVQVTQAEKLDLILLVITDIQRHNSRILCAGNPSIIRSLPLAENLNGTLEAPSVVSRKKQIFPAVTAAIRKMAR